MKYVASGFSRTSAKDTASGFSRTCLRWMVGAAVLGAAMGSAETAFAQPGGAAAPTVQVQARQQIAAFEGALENAVRMGGQLFEQRLHASTAANMVMVAGLTRARGFRLDDYGVVFDVEFPSMRRSIVWSLQELQRAEPASTGKPKQPSAVNSSVQPREMYQTEITNALVNAILDYTGPFGVGVDEWLTVAARESVVDRRFVPGDPNDTAITVILRIKGSDLNALRDRQLSREEARKRVEVKYY